MRKLVAYFGPQWYHSRGKRKGRKESGKAVSFPAPGEERCNETLEKEKGKLTSRTYKIGSLRQYKYVVVLSEYNGSILLSRHKKRTTWETQGGHIEPGEEPLEAAKRELYEESGAVDFEIEPLCDYWAGVEGTDDWANGMVFHATIRKLGQMPASEMAETRQFGILPQNLTYPEITPVLFQYLFDRRKSCGCTKV